MEQSQLSQYTGVLILGIFGILFSFGTLIASDIVGRLMNKVRRREKIKDTAYECGMVPIGAGNARLSVKFYVVAMLFILFDIEVIFMYPWAVVYKKMLHENAALILGGMITFIGILFIGYIYAFKKKAFDWND